MSFLLTFFGGLLGRLLVGAVLGIALAYPLHVMEVDRLQKQILTMQRDAAAADAARKGQEAVALNDALTAHAAAVASLDQKFNTVLSALDQLDATVSPTVARLDASFKELANDPSFACLQRPLPPDVLSGLRLLEQPAAATNSSH